MIIEADEDLFCQKSFLTSLSKNKWRGIPPPFGGPGSFDQPQADVAAISFHYCKQVEATMQEQFEIIFLPEAMR